MKYIKTFLVLPMALLVAIGSFVAIGAKVGYRNYFNTVFSEMGVLFFINFVRENYSGFLAGSLFLWAIIIGAVLV
jgi:hypothetical protein